MVSCCVIALFSTLIKLAVVRELGMCCVNGDNLRHILDADSISVYEDDGRLEIIQQIESYLEYKKGYAKNIMFNPSGDDKFCKYFHKLSCICS